MPDQIAHIGYPKTGSTFLQQEVFPLLNDINYVDFHTCVQLFQDVIYLDDLDFDTAKWQKEFTAISENSTSLFSQEALTGAPFTYKGLNRSRIVGRLKQLGFTKIIITIRNQEDMLDSLYRQYVYQGGVMKFKDFLNMDGKWNHYIRAFNLDYLKYDRLIKLYFEQFGKANVLVLPQEMLKSDREGFLKKVMDFIGTEPPDVALNKRSNESMSNLSTHLLRLINHFTFNSQRPNQLLSNRIGTKPIKKLFQAILDPYFFKFFSNKDSYLKERYRKQLADYYAQSNKELDEITDLNLSDFGYLD